MLGLHEHSLSYGQVAVARGTVSLNIMSQRENGFRVNSKARGDQPGSISVARKPAGFSYLGIRSHVSKAIYYFIPSLVAIVRGITSLMRIGLFLYYSWCLVYFSGYRTTLY